MNETGPRSQAGGLSIGDGNDTDQIDEQELDLHRSYERIIGEELAKRAGFLYYGDKLNLL